LQEPYLALLFAAIGLLTGSAIAFGAPRLVAYRLEKPSSPSSLLLIPLAGPWLNQGPRRLPLAFEVLIAGTFAGLAIHFGHSDRLILGALFTALLALIAYIDLEHRLVLNRLSFPGVVLALALSPLWPGIGIGSALLGACVGLVIFAALQVLGRGALGSGDTKLAMLIGAIRGMPGVLSALVIGIFIGGLAALFLMIALRRGRKDYFAYAPYLAAGAVLSFFVVSP
jgi:leader peptidase (prepilin peptidase) / N-methyltransferase